MSRGKLQTTTVMKNEVRVAESWLDKYKPKNISELTTNLPAVEAINNWIANFDTEKAKFLAQQNTKDKKKNKKETPKSCMIITGNHGVGKTSTVNLVLKRHCYQIRNINFNNSKTDIEYVMKLVVSPNIINIISDIERQFAIVIDEVESITSPAEKKCIATLRKLNDQHWYCPIIFISNNKHNKLLLELKHNSFEVKMWPPRFTDLKSIALKIAEKEDIKIKTSKVIETVVLHSQGDIRRLILILHEVRHAFAGRYVSSAMIAEYCKTSKEKDADIGLNKATEELLYSYRDIDDCIKYYESEKVLVPLMLHHHYVQSIVKNNSNIKKQNELIQIIAESLSEGDMVENNIYSNQSWDMQEVHGFYTCVLPSYYLCKEIDDIEPCRVPLTFASDLHNTSLKFNNMKKNIKNTNKCLKNMNIFDYIFINKLVKKLIKQNKIKECCELLKDYNIKLSHIESLLKIVKMSDDNSDYDNEKSNTNINNKKKESNTILTSKQKNEFLKYIKK